jgi:hypothetical protein
VWLKLLLHCHKENGAMPCVILNIQQLYRSLVKWKHNIFALAVGSAIFHEHEFRCEPRDGVIGGRNAPKPPSGMCVRHDVQ